MALLQVSLLLVLLVLLVPTPARTQLVLNLRGKLGRPGQPNLASLMDHVHGLCQNWSSVEVILADNAIRELPADAFIRRHGDALYGFTCVSSLNLSNNSLTVLPSGLLGWGSEMSTLGQFDASWNSIRTLGRHLFHRKLSLRKVNLSHNKLEVFEPWPFLLSRSVTVNLSHNAISKLTNKLGVKLSGAVSTNVKVDLQYNQLRHFRTEMFFQYVSSAHATVYNLAHLQGFNLQNNPWLCDCHVYLLVESFNNSYYRDLAHYLMRCHDPPSLRGKYLDYFYDHPEALVCDLTGTEGVCPPGCSCLLRPAHDLTLVDCKGAANVTGLPHILPSGPLSLDLSGLGLDALAPGTQLRHARHLNVAHNRLRTIGPDLFSFAPDLRTLNLSFNRLQKLPVQITALRFSDVDLVGNDFICSCDWVWVGQWTRLDPEGRRSRNITCTSGHVHMLLSDVTEGSLGCYTTLAITLTLTLGLSLLVALLLLLASWKWKYKSRILLYHVTGLHPFDRPVIDAEVERRYDLYLSADRENMEVVTWIRDTLLPKLERGRRRYRVYFPLRDELGGDCTADQVVAGLDASRRAVFVVTRSALRSGWWGEEFDQAAWALEQGQGGPILLLLFEAVDAEQVLQEPLKNMLQEKQYLSLSDSWWWKHLLYELPVPRNH